MGPVMIKGCLQMCITSGVVFWPLGNWQYYFLSKAHNKQGYYQSPRPIRIED